MQEQALEVTWGLEERREILRRRPHGNRETFPRARVGMNERAKRGWQHPLSVPDNRYLKRPALTAGCGGRIRAHSQGAEIGRASGRERESNSLAALSLQDIQHRA